MSRLDVRLNGRPLLPFQAEFVRSRARNRHVWGGFGSGKTTAAALAYLAHACENGWHSAYGPNDRPFSFILGPTHKSLTESAWRVLRSLIPDALIAKEKKSPDWFVELVNGHQIRPRTIASAVEGASATGIWADEIHLLADESAWINFRSRVRDPLARSHVVLTSGLPEDRGWQREHFERPEFSDDPHRLNLHVSARSNSYLPKSVLSDLLGSVAASNVARYIDGEWHAPDGLVYSSYTATAFKAAPHAHGGNLWDKPGDKSASVLLGFDIGRQSVVTVWQEVPRVCRRELALGVFETFETVGLHMVDEIIVDEAPVEAVCQRVKARGWKPKKAYADPTTRDTETSAIRRELGISTLQAERGQNEENLEWGYDHVNWALRDALDNARVTFYSGLPRERRSVLSGITKYHYAPNGKARRDNIIDHALDSARYVVVNVLKPAHRAGRR